jgi:hypothetical protein
VGRALPAVLLETGPEQRKHHHDTPQEASNMKERK